MSASPELFESTSAFNGGNAAFIESLYAQYLTDPQSVPDDWRRRFDQLPGATDKEKNPREVESRFLRLTREKSTPATSNQLCISPDSMEQQEAVLRLVSSYRVRGHQLADLDPLKLRPPVYVPDLDLAYHKLDSIDPETLFSSGSLFGSDLQPLKEIIRHHQAAYCGTIGSEFTHITDTGQRLWIQRRIEERQHAPPPSVAKKQWLLTLLTAAEGLERHLHARYVGQKRFSLEGGESLIPLLDELIQYGGGVGVQEYVIGMAHRGRLNVLTNILGKPPQFIFDEFEGRVEIDPQRQAGDVKYHMGFSTDIHTPGGIVHIALGFNPSHLEIINPVIEGSVRARQRRRNDLRGERVIPVLIHGDAAFAGQGVVMETLNLSQTRGYSTGGTIHVIINNQIGFTTSNPLDARSTVYCTDVAKMIQAPIFHVNGDDPEAVLFVSRLAMDYRMRFHRDVVIDMLCYRRHGHNEADEPAVTQPQMYKKIRNHATVREIYAQRLVDEQLITPEWAQNLVENYQASMDRGQIITCPVACPLTREYKADFRPYKRIDWTMPAQTQLDEDAFRELTQAMLKVPQDIELHPRVAKIWSERTRMAAGDQLIDWGFAENLAYAALLSRGWPVRLSGQDCGRGTFFHRHAVLHNQLNGEGYVPLQHISKDQADFVVIDSLLSEEAVLGYEYGFSAAEPECLTIWEAQFGDFANGAQVVIDQFITSAGEKWGLRCGLVLLLPHGYEGQGAEHSSARLERFLRLCANQNIQVCNPTTPAQVFHMLCRQMIRQQRIPLIVMSPKSLLRHRLATSPKADFISGAFKPIIDEIDDHDPKKIKRLIMCSGKVYYELLEARRTRKLEDIAIIRIEQLYPFPLDHFCEVIARYPNVEEYTWCQEEPQNQGAWDQIKHRFYNLLDREQVHYVGRPTSSSPAVGYRTVHLQQQETLINEALSGVINPAMNLIPGKSRKELRDQIQDEPKEMTNR